MSGATATPLVRRTGEGEPIWTPTAFTEHRDRLLNQEIAQSFFRRVVERADSYLSDEHFTVDGTLMEASAIAVGLSVALAGSVQAKDSTMAALKIRVSNFGKVNDHYYRGAQPKGRDYADLAALGVKAIVDLRDDAEVFAPSLAKQAGLNYVVIPLSGWERPEDAAVTRFLAFVNDPANQPVYVHCKVGKHRTGAMTAVYRMTQDGWNATQAYTEMKKYHFKSFFTPHTNLKEFVFEYYTQLQNAAAPAASKSGGL